MSGSAIRELLRLTETTGVACRRSAAADAFPVEALREATAKVLRDAPGEALQYAASEGHEPLREWVAARLRAQGQRVEAGQVLITHGLQQGLDVVGKLLIDAGSAVAVETPTYSARCHPAACADRGGGGPARPCAAGALGLRSSPSGVGVAGVVSPRRCAV